MPRCWLPQSYIFTKRAARNRGEKDCYLLPLSALAVLFVINYSWRIIDMSRCWLPAELYFYKEDSEKTRRERLLFTPPLRSRRSLCD